MPLGFLRDGLYSSTGRLQLLSASMAGRSKKTNKFCSKSDLSNEASVEHFFVNRLLADLGYGDHMIRPKTAIEAKRVAVGSKRTKIHPDYILVVGGEDRWVCDAKSTTENIEDHEEQLVSYCTALRRHNGSPVSMFMVTNGLKTSVFNVDDGQPLVALDFEDFVDGNEKYNELRRILDPAAVSAASSATSDVATIRFRRKSASEINSDFAWCHRLIHRREGLGYSASFMELVKLVFLKLLSDKEVHRLHPEISADTEQGVDVPSSDIRFSVPWIEARETDTPNPVNTIQFRNLLTDLEREISAGSKKRIFAPDAALNLKNGTIKEIAERIQGADLLAIDADLNGRLFETFLNATLRGKDLGQFFTPRSVVKLGVGLADLTVNAQHQDVVLDGCCGTGGFLIDALADMWDKVENLASLSIEKRSRLREKIAHDCIAGIDVARDPALARIARINMYLHGDGGSSIFQLDALDKVLASTAEDAPETVQEKAELQARIGSDGFADVVLTNPPFAKEYSRSKDGKKTEEDRILDEYELAFDNTGGTARPLPTLSSGIMFLERYLDMLKPGGRMVTVIDDSVLGGANFSQARKWFRKHFVIEAVVSLPGDAFQRSQARVKTSFLVMRKRIDDETQPDVFMAYATAVGIDDPPRERILPGDEELRKAATAEIARLTGLFAEFREKGGTRATRPWIVPASALEDRMDVKACLLEAGSQADRWKTDGHDVVKLSEIAAPKTFDASDTLTAETHPDEVATYLRVKYAGFAESGDEVAISDANGTLHRVEEGDIVISHINAVHGAAAVVTEEHAGHVVTNEFTVLQALDDVDPRVVWALLRTPQARADMLVLSTGIGRTRIRWSTIEEMLLPLPDPTLTSEVLEALDKAEAGRRQAEEQLAHAQLETASRLGLNGEEAKRWIEAFKPPR